MYLNVIELAESFGVEESVVEGWIRDEGLPFVPDRGRLLFDRAQVIEWAAQRGRAAKAGFLAAGGSQLHDGRRLQRRSTRMPAGRVYPHGRRLRRDALEPAAECDGLPLVRRTVRNVFADVGLPTISRGRRADGCGAARLQHAERTIIRI